MSDVRIYGIKNCDTMKKAFAWLEAHNVPYAFHDYKKHGVDAGVLDAAIARYGWEAVINRRGTTWRKLPADIRSTLDERRAAQLAAEQPSLVKRPLLTCGDDIVLGFDDDTYKSALG